MRIDFIKSLGFALSVMSVLVVFGCDSTKINDQGSVNIDEQQGQDKAVFRCSTDDDCLSGFKCLQAVGEKYSVCTAKGAGLNCEQYNLDGDEYLSLDAPEACFGLRGDCDDGDPTIYPGAPEICDGKDNNCDGNIDEDLDDVLCEKQLGVCAGAGTTCEQGALVECNYASYATSQGNVYQEETKFELCDGIDNDCDGNVDEGCCMNSLPLDGPDVGDNRDCNCFEGQVFECGRTTGECTRGIRFCSQGNVPALDLPCLQVEAESISDLEDETLRCDPDTEETRRENPDGSVSYCVTERISPLEDLHDACKFAGDPGCERSVWRTLAAEGDLTQCQSNSDCSGAREVCAFDGVCRATVVEPVKEICNGLDDDCDGSVDNHFGSRNSAACGMCPFNSLLSDVRTGTGAGGTNTFMQYCVDVYEASRPDASDANAGSDSTHAVSRGGVLPWTGVNAQEAEAACAAVELRELVGGSANSPDRLHVVAAKSLCESGYWADLCSGDQKRESNDVNRMAYYPYSQHNPQGNASASYEAGKCNDSNEAGALKPTGSYEECKVGTPNVFSATAVGAESAPYDFVGNALEWTADSGAINLDDPTKSRTTNVFLMGGSYKENEKMTCRKVDGYNEGVAATSKYKQLVRTERGLDPCTSDADCGGAGEACLNVIGGASAGKLCVKTCNNSNDCNGRGECQPYAQTAPQKLCVMPDAIEGDYSAYDDVGFRCCSLPLNLR